ncbi:hypothetical protein LINPERHAP2_LOCUS12337 [Linum perenne]
MLMLSWSTPHDTNMEKSDMALDKLIDSVVEVNTTTRIPENEVVPEAEGNEKATVPSNEVDLVESNDKDYLPHPGIDKGDANINVEFRSIEENQLPVNTKADVVNPTDVAVNQTGGTGDNLPYVRRWLGVDEVLAEMEQPSSPSSSAYIQPNYNNDSSSESNFDGRSHENVSEAGSNGDALSDARNEYDEFDQVRDEEQMLNERGWGYEEDEDPRPDRYPIFRSSMDLDAAEIVIGRESESFAQHPEHDCLVEEDIRAANPAFLAKHYVARFYIDPLWSLRNFILKVIMDFSLKIIMMKAYKSKRVKVSLIHSKESDQFKKLWDYRGLLCEHALACISYNQNPIEPYWDPCYTLSNYRLAYGNSINPLNDSSQWSCLKVMRASSSNPVLNTYVRVTPPPQHVRMGNETPSVRLTRSKMKVTRGGHTC